jgi:hypothetical protein
MSLLAATEMTAIATAVLAAGAILTSVFAGLAFSKQSRQLKDQQGINEKLRKVLTLQAQDLTATSAIRDRDTGELRQAQARQVFLVKKWHERDPALDQVTANLTSQQHSPVLVMTIENSSDRPIHDVELRWDVDGVPADVEDTWKTFEPHVKQSKTRPIPTGNESLTAVLRFTDANDFAWERRPGREPTER